MDEFIALSKLLTGLPLVAAGDKTSVDFRMATDYLRLLKERFGSDFDVLLVLFRATSATPDPLTALMQDPSFTGPTETAARQVVLLWMLSQYQLVDAAGKSGDFDGGFYEKGSVWPLIGAHATAFSHLPYGYWGGKPNAD